MAAAALAGAAMAGAVWEQGVLHERTRQAPAAPAAQTESDLAPIFRCSGAGGEVVISLGQGGKTLFFSCDEVKS